MVMDANGPTEFFVKASHMGILVEESETPPQFGEVGFRRFATEALAPKLITLLNIADGLPRKPVGHDESGAL
jgi:hypothetical protein